MSIAPDTPVIVGVAQQTIPRGRQPGPEPLDAWVDVCLLAADDAGIPADALKATEYLAVADCFGWEYDDQVGRLADRLGANPRGRWRSAPSGTSGHTMLKRAADAIRNGAKLTVICGAESNATLRWYAKQGEAPPWTPQAERSWNLAEQQHPGEDAIGLLEGTGAAYTFAMRDIARRAHLGIAPNEYVRQNGELMAGLTRVAAANPDAWFQTARDANFLTELRPDNRPITLPYSKHMVAIMDVDIAAAVILTSEAEADRLGIPRSKRVYPWTGCYANDPVDTAVRPDLWRSPAMAAASKAALDAAGLTVDEIAHIDLYSCFPAAVNFASDALGVTDRPGDRLTVTGGLPYGGGPGSSYVMTSLVKMTERLRSDAGAFGLVSGLGMMMSNHCYGIYSTRPPEGVKPIDEKAVQAEVDRVPLLPVRSDHDGPVKVVTYTVKYDRNGDPTNGAAICDLPDGARAYARFEEPSLVKRAIETELVGATLYMTAGAAAGTLREG